MSKRKHGSSFSERLIQFTNCRILYRSSLINEDLWMRNGKICNPEKIFFGEKIQADVKIDCKNLIIAPGFIDVQINGTTTYPMSIFDNDSTVDCNSRLVNGRCLS